MNWVAMARGDIDGADATRNVALTVLVALIPASAAAFDGSASLELSYGNKTFSSSLIGDWGIVPDKVYLVGSFGAVRQPPIDGIVSQPSYLLGLGLDVMPSMHWVTSLNLSVSPKAGDTETRVLTFLPNTPTGTLTRTRRSAQAIFAAGYQSAGLADVEWSLDASLLGSWYELSTHAVLVYPEEKLLPTRTLERVTPLLLARPGAGFTLIFKGRTEVGLRGSYTAYSTDPTLAGRLPELEALVASEDFQNSEVGTLLASGAFSAAPPWFDARASLLQRIGTRVTARFAYAFTRYVHGIGNAHTVSSKWTLKLTGWARVWAAATLQYDQLNTETEASFWSVYGTLGAELATE